MDAVVAVIRQKAAPLGAAFYDRDPALVARELLGAVLQVDDDEGRRGVVRRRGGAHSAPGTCVVGTAGSPLDNARPSQGSVTRTGVRALAEEERREEIARMLSGATVTDEARAQAGRLLETA